jgi:hypothetical protein
MTARGRSCAGATPSRSKGVLDRLAERRETRIADGEARG